MLVRALDLEHVRLISLCGSGGKTGLMFALAAELSAAGERVLVTTTTHIAAAEARGHAVAFAAGAGEVLEIARGLQARLVVAAAGPAADPHKLAGLAPGEVDALAHDAWFTRVLVEADGSRRRPLKAPARWEPVFPAATDAVLMVAGLSGLNRPLTEETVFRSELWSRLTGLAAGAPITPHSLAQVVLDEQGLARGSPPSARKVLFLNQADDASRVTAAKEVLKSIAAGAGRRPERCVIGRLLPLPWVVPACAG